MQVFPNVITGIGWTLAQLEPLKEAVFFMAPFWGSYNVLNNVLSFIPHSSCSINDRLTFFFRLNFFYYYYYMFLCQILKAITKTIQTMFFSFLFPVWDEWPFSFTVLVITDVAILILCSSIFFHNKAFCKGFFFTFSDHWYNTMQYFCIAVCYACRCYTDRLPIRPCLRQA